MRDGIVSATPPGHDSNSSVGLSPTPHPFPSSNPFLSFFCIQHVLKQGKMIEELQNRRSPSPEPPRLVQSPRHNVSQSPIQPSTAVKAPFSPLNARSHFKSASANLPSRPSTPSKQTYINSDKPQPLPTPETWASSPKLRRLTREHELEQLREKQTAGRAK